VRTQNKEIAALCAVLTAQKTPKRSLRFIFKIIFRAANWKKYSFFLYLRHASTIIHLQNYYEILGLTLFATASEIKQAYKKMAMLYHPDRNPDNPQAEELFKRLNEAYHVLTDPQRKQAYDQLLVYGRITNLKPSARRAYYAYRREPQAKPYYHITDMQAGMIAILLITYFFFALNSFYTFHSRLRYILAVNAYEVKDYQTAIEHAKKSISSDDTFAKAHLLAGIIHLEHLKQNMAAAENFTRLIETTEIPKLDYYLKRAVAYSNANKNKEALHDFNFVLSHNPSSPELLAQIGKAYFYQLNNYEEALKIYNRLDSMGLANEELYLNQSSIHKHLNNNELAVSALTKAIGLNPLNATAYYDRAQMYLHLQQVEKTCEDWQQAKKLDPTMVDHSLDFFCEDHNKE
jgi:curved DNA-binding protein CbpA